MRLEFALQLLAQTKCDAIHVWMQLNDPAYAQAVAAGQITAWAKPYQDVGADGVTPINSLWYVNLKPRSVDALSAAEKLLLKPYLPG